MDENVYKHLAERLDALPNAFPSTEDGIELRLLAKLFTPEEADLAARLRLTLETPAQIADRIGGDPDAHRIALKGMARRGLIAVGQSEHGLGYGLMPFVVGIYEMQAGRLDTELAKLFEKYYLQAFGQMLSIQPPVHRVIPVQESIRVDLEIHPFESVTAIVENAKSWGVLDCICRTQKSLIGEPCEHPLDVCMIFSQKPGAYDHNATVRALTKEQAIDTLQRAADAGLVHSVSNNQEGSWYICNCCTCSCGILRGIKDLGIANVVARSGYVNQVDDNLCINCGDCVEQCQFEALSMDESAQVDTVRCVGCGVCIVTCLEDALSLVRRPFNEASSPPATEADWRLERAQIRGQDLNKVL
ncbi:MAG: 4Fe-4S binding protein [Anaerolineales bacterium]|nr:4Fe-4S binding protein [Anaerolineales bacterium]